MAEELWYEVAERYITAGRIPFPINDTVIEILETIITEEQAQFLLLLKKPSYNIEEIKVLVNLDEDALNRMLNDVMHIGALVGTRSKREGVMVYRIPPFFPGLMEFTLMRGERGEKQKKLAELMERFLKGLVDGTQKNYDAAVAAMRSAPPVNRIVPVEEAIDTVQDTVLPMDEISKIIEQNEPIGLAVCYCRHQRDLLDQPCKMTTERKNCFQFGRTAEFAIAQGFARQISREEALRIFKACEDAGLVHKAFHANLDAKKEINGICNCCTCCCGTYTTHFAGASPLMSQTSYLARVNESTCIGCGICTEHCSSSAIRIEGSMAVIDDERCFGCGICAHMCPEKALHLERTEMRTAFIPPPRLNRGNMTGKTEG